MAGSIVLERAMAVLLPTTWEWDALTRAEQGAEIARHGVLWYFREVRGVVWQPGYMLLVAAVHHLVHGNPVVNGEWISAVAAAVVAAYTYGLTVRAGGDYRTAALAPWLILLPGYALAYFSQAMTEAFAVAACAGTCYHLLRVSECDAGSRRRHQIAAAAWLLAHAMVRWEGILQAFMVPAIVATSVGWPSPSGIRRIIPRLVVPALPTLGYAAAWAWYTRWATGSVGSGFGWVYGHAVAKPEWFRGNAVLALVATVGALFSVAGTLWLAVFPQVRRAFAERGGDPATVARRSLALFVCAHIAWVYVGCALGVLAGWPRYLLYVLPMLAAVIAVAPLSTVTRRRHYIATGFLGLLILVEHRIRHNWLFRDEPAERVTTMVGDERVYIPR